jgi:hypothetical protein
VYHNTGDRVISPMGSTARALPGSTWNVIAAPSSDSTARPVATISVGNSAARSHALTAALLPAGSARVPPSILERQPLGPLEEAARFRSLAEAEPIAALRRHLSALAR